MPSNMLACPHIIQFFYLVRSLFFAHKFIFIFKNVTAVSDINWNKCVIEYAPSYLQPKEMPSSILFLRVTTRKNTHT